uniref:GH18 domain-containing protein n=1 Tax=Piliocolobus tephrosceles TaxID=591936 RepID=A0A8C9I6V5_9PRIM
SHISLLLTNLVCFFNCCFLLLGPAKSFPKNVNPYLYTQLMYAFATVNDKIASYEWNDKTHFVSFCSNSDLVNLLATGTWNFDTQNFLPTFIIIGATDANHKIFICSVIDFLHQHGFDGIDLHIKYPGTQGIPPEDKQRGFTVLARMAFEEEAKGTGHPRLHITAAVSAGKETTDAGYEIADIKKLLDFINVMTYDFQGGWDTSTVHNGPLHIESKDQGEMHYFNCEYAMMYWRDNEVLAEKFITGLPTYGRTFWLRSSDTSGRAGSSGPSACEAGFGTYCEICTFLSGATSTWNEDQKVPYAYKNTEWIASLKNNNTGFKSYIHQETTFLRHYFAGSMVWTIDLDDFSRSFCNERKYLLISKLKSHLGLSSGFCADIGRGSGSGEGGSDGGSDGEGGSDGGSRGDGVFCGGKADGIYSNPEDSNKFFWCVEGNTFHLKYAQGWSRTVNVATGLIYTRKILVSQILLSACQTTSSNMSGSLHII